MFNFLLNIQLLINFLFYVRLSWALINFGQWLKRRKVLGTIVHFKHGGNMAADVEREDINVESDLPRFF